MTAGDSVEYRIPIGRDWLPGVFIRADADLLVIRPVNGTAHYHCDPRDVRPTE